MVQSIKCIIITQSLEINTMSKTRQLLICRAVVWGQNWPRKVNRLFIIKVHIQKLASENQPAFSAFVSTPIKWLLLGRALSQIASKWCLCRPETGNHCREQTGKPKAQFNFPTSHGSSNPPYLAVFSFASYLFQHKSYSTWWLNKCLNHCRCFHAENSAGMTV